MQSESPVSHLLPVGVPRAAEPSVQIWGWERPCRRMTPWNLAVVDARKLSPAEMEHNGTRGDFGTWCTCACRTALENRWKPCPLAHLGSLQVFWPRNVGLSTRYKDHFWAFLYVRVIHIPCIGFTTFHRNVCRKPKHYLTTPQWQ